MNECLTTAQHKKQIGYWVSDDGDQSKTSVHQADTVLLIYASPITVNKTPVGDQSKTSVHQADTVLLIYASSVSVNKTPVGDQSKTSVHQADTAIDLCFTRISE